MRSGVSPLVLFGSVLAGLMLVYWPTRHFAFIDADTPIYVLHPRVVAPPTFENLWWLLTHAIAVNWTPLAWYTHILDHRLFGPDSGAHHLSNVVYHAAAVGAVYVFLRRATGQPGRSLVVALLFAFHPLRVESVAWVVERKDLVSGLFAALSLWAYAGYAQTQNDRRWRWYVAAWLLLVLSLLGKAMLVTMPFLLLLLDYWPLSRTPWLGPVERRVSLGRLLLEKAPFVPPVLAVSYIARQGVDYTSASNDPISLTQRSWNGVYSVAQYLRKLLMPSDLSFWYPHPYLRPTGGHGLSALVIVECASLLVLLALLCVINLRKRPYLAVGFGWFVGTLAPVLGVYFQAGRQGMADRFTYFPSIGLGIALVWLAADAFEAWQHPRSRVLAAAAVVVVVAVFAYRSRVETMRWRDTETLYEDVIAQNPENTHIHYLLGQMLIQRGELDRGLEHLRAAALLMPEWDDMVTGLADALRKAGRRDEALHWYQIAYQRAPQHNHTRINFATALAAAGRFDEAIPLFREAAQTNPRSLAAHIDLATALAIRGKLPEAKQELELALQLDPRSPQALFAAARVALQLDDRAGAIERLHELLRVAPDQAAGRQLLGQLESAVPSVSSP